jgi:hypothetical protein
LTVLLGNFARRGLAVGEALKACAGGVKAAGPGGWLFALSNGVPHTFSAMLAGDWLLLDAGLGAVAESGELWRLLGANARLGGPGKFARERGRLRLRAEIALDEEIDLASRLRETCDSLREALRVLHGEAGRAEVAGREGSESAAEGGEDAGSEVAESESCAKGLKALCEEAGWDCVEKDGGRLAAQLEAGGAFRQATLAAGACGRLSASVELFRAAGLGDVSRHAVAALLLGASASLRLARAAAVEHADGAVAARFEVSFRTRPRAAELGHTLSALSVACAEFGREAEALCDARVAARFVAARGVRCEWV